VQVCFERGAFDRGATVMTAQTLVWLALGLVAYAAGRVLTGAFYALQDTATPVKLAMEALVVNLVLAVLFLKPMHVGGLALATALSSSLNAWRLLMRLERRLNEPLVPHLARPALRMSLAAAAMGAGCVLAWRWLAPVIPPPAALSVVILGGIILYGSFSYLIGVEECSTVLRWLARLISRHPSSRA